MDTTTITIELVRIRACLLQLVESHFGEKAAASAEIWGDAALDAHDLFNANSTQPGSREEALEHVLAAGTMW